MGRVLIVDDHPDQCRPLVRLLQLSGHSAWCAPGGRAALASLNEADPPDLVVCDVMMPEMDGTEVLRRIKQAPRTRQTPVVMYTALSDREVADHLRRLGADDVWVKSRVGVDAMLREFAKYMPPAPIDADLQPTRPSQTHPSPP